MRTFVSGTARRLGEHILFPHSAAKNTLPKLKISQASTGTAPVAWFICPDYDHPSGGIRKLYRSVDLLNEAGLAAAIMHRRRGFKCTWFSHRTRIASSDEAVLNHHDVIVIPEIYCSSENDLPPGVRTIIFNQNAYLMIDSIVSEWGATSSYVKNPDLSGILVVSEDNARAMEYIFPGVQVSRVRPGLDLSLHYPPQASKPRRIAYMPRKRFDESNKILSLLRLRGILEGWEVVAIDRRTEEEAAELLRSAQIFLSFNKLEGFGLPPLEALACGCLVVGFHGLGGREFFYPPFATAVEDGDILGFTRAVEETIHLVDRDPAMAAAASEAGIRFVRERYSPEQERQDLLDVFVPLLRS